MVKRPSISRWWVGGEGLGIPSPHLGCPGICSSRFVFPLMSAGPRAGRYGPEEHFCSWLVLLVTMLFVLCSRSLSSVPRCSASGWYEPEGHLCCDALWLVSLVAMHITLCFTFGCSIPVVTQRSFHMVQTVRRTTEIPSCTCIR